MEVAIVMPSELVASVELARALLDAGDVERALKVSSVAYDQAKAAAISADRVKASRELVEKARRLQGEALKIESLCSIAMADAVDEGQAKGEVRARGRQPAGLSGGATLDELGVSSKRLSEARQLRNAVKKDSSFIERVIEDRLAQGLEPSRASLRSIAGRKSPKERGADEILADSVALPSGEIVSDLAWYELPVLIRQYRQSAEILEAISRHCIPPDDHLKVSEIITASMLRRFVEERSDG